MFERLLVALGGAVALAAFLLMVKLMHDMTVQMTVMTEQVARMAEQVVQLNAHVQAMGTDVHGMRQGMERMAGIVQRGGQQLEQIEQLSPLEMMRGVMPGQQSR
jgi:methyl-accepting chemotaxis protein